MKINFVYPRVGNLYHLVSNLAEWHFSCRKVYKDFWLQKTGQLTRKEAEALKEASNMFRKYGFGHKYWGREFLIKDEIRNWDELKLFFGTDTTIFKKVADVFQKRFQKLWKEEKILLKSWSERLSSSEKKLNPVGLTRTLDQFFNVKKRPEKITAILLMNSSNSATAGGGNLKPGLITLEISRTSFEYTRPVTLTFWHELVHNIWQAEHYQNLIQHFIGNIKDRGSKYFAQKIPLRHIINEGVTECLFPHGYLAEKYFGFPCTDYFQKELGNGEIGNSMKCWRDYAAQELIPTVKKYIEKKKSIDYKFLKDVYVVWEVFKSKSHSSNS